MGINQSAKPVTTIRNGNLCIGGCDLVELAQKYGTPLYVIDEVTLRKMCKEYREAFKNLPNIRMTYASKALCNTAIAALLDSEGFGFDVVSVGELYTVYKAGVDMKKVTFNGNNKTQDELELAVKYGIGRFSVDNFYEAELLNLIAEKNNKKVKILLRITPGIECHTHEYIQTGQIDSKFGFDLSQLDEIINLIKTEYANLDLMGLHAHIGSQIFELKSYYDEIDVLIKILADINNKYALDLSEINIGGGLGVTYTVEDKPPSAAEFGATIVRGLGSACKKYGIKLNAVYIEPGRSIISTSGVTLYTVGSTKQVPNGRKYVALDGGMADNPRPSLYNAKYSAELVNNPDNREYETVTLAGRFCESGDILIENIKLPELAAGDTVCIYNTGAYNYSMASNYNRVQKPAMVLVNNSQSDMIVCRESLDDLLAADKLPDRLKKNG